MFGIVEENQAQIDSYQSRTEDYLQQTMALIENLTRKVNDIQTRPVGDHHQASEVESRPRHGGAIVDGATVVERWISGEPNMELVDAANASPRGREGPTARANSQVPILPVGEQRVQVPVDVPQRFAPAQPYCEEPVVHGQDDVVARITVALDQVRIPTYGRRPTVRAYERTDRQQARNIHYASSNNDPFDDY